MLLIISVIVVIQALLPFIDRTEKCARLTKIVSFVALPILIILLCIVHYALDKDDGKRLICWDVYTGSIQILLIIVFLGKRFCCGSCCASARAKEKGLV